jgi:hypothetical protein
MRHVNRMDVAQACDDIPNLTIVFVPSHYVNFDYLRDVGRTYLILFS